MSEKDNAVEEKADPVVTERRGVAEVRIPIHELKMSDGRIAYILSCPYIQPTVADEILVADDTIINLLKQSAKICMAHANPDQFQSEEMRPRSAPKPSHLM